MTHLSSKVAPVAVAATTTAAAAARLLATSGVLPPLRGGERGLPRGTSPEGGCVCVRPSSAAAAILRLQPSLYLFDR